ncbi:MAG TPA: hypothetical protein DEB31_01730 [Clostridiales bacterium]|nr:hypothetical protein [Clostridiales bacterium]
MAKYVYGTYNTMQEAKNMIAQLEQKGYPRSSISVMADGARVSNLRDLGVSLEDTYHNESNYESLWSRIKRFFGREVHSAHTAIFGHQQDLRNGKILVMVDCSTVPQPLQTAAKEKDTAYWNAAHNLAVNHPDEQTIRLMQEHLRVSKENVTTGEVIVKKRVVQDTETINVPVRHEELTIERHPVTGHVTGLDKFEDETYSFPLTEEQVHVSKEPVVVEEVRVSKRQVDGEKQVSDTVRREELDVNKTGNVILENPKRK